MWYRFIMFTFNLIKSEINEKEFDFDLIIADLKDYDNVHTVSNVKTYW